MKDFKEKYYGSILRNRIKNYVLKFADNIEDRINNKLRHSTNLMTMVIRSTKIKDAYFILRNYLERKNEIRIVTDKFVKFHENVSAMQRKMKIILNRKVGRFKIISDIWEKEIQTFFLGKCLNKNNKNFRYFK